MIVTPRAMKTPRATRAIATPTSRTFCWNSFGTAKVVMMMRKTNRLSTDNAFSVNQPAKYSPPAWPPPKTQTPTPNRIASAM